MNEQITNLRTSFANKWESLVTVDALDEEQAHLGRLFNILLLINMGIVISIALTFVLMQSLGMVDFPLWLAVAIPLAFLPFTFFCFAQTRRGRIRSTINIYVWVNFFGISSSIFLFDGPSAPGWLLYIWTITIAGTLLAPRYALGMTGGVVGYFLLLLLLSQLGLYTPPFTFGLAGDLFLFIAFAMLMLVSTVGALTYLNMSHLGETLRRLRITMRELDAHRRTLEQRVAERTRDLERRAVQLQAAAEVARDATTARDLSELLNRAVNLIRERFGFYHAGIFLTDDLGEYAVLQAAAGEAGRLMLEQEHRLKVGEAGIVGYVTAAGSPRIALDVGEDAVYFDNPLMPETRSEMALPLRAGGEIIGALDVQSREAEAFDDEDVAALQTMADQLAVAIQSIRLLRESQQTVRELEAASGRYLREGWRAEQSRGYRYRGLGVEPVSEQPPQVRQAWQQQRSITGPRSETGAANNLAVPLKLRDQVLGVLNLRFEGKPASPETVRWVEDVAERLAMALESARLFGETQSRARREQTIRQITEQMRRAVDVETILQTTITRLGDAVGAPRVYVRLGAEMEKLSDNNKGNDDE